MQDELNQLQMTLLASVVVLCGLCGLLLTALWLVINISHLSRMVRGKTVAEIPVVGLADDEQPVLRPGGSARVVEELDWSHGTGTTVPVGALVSLLTCVATTSGPRWSARWDGHYLWPIPPESLRPITPLSELRALSMTRFRSKSP